MRIGQGFDVHAFGDGDHVMLGGVRIAHARGIVAHSDGDVVIHALCDAILGALSLGDIGRHFPPSDPQWRGADSRTFLRRVAQLLDGPRQQPQLERGVGGLTRGELEEARDGAEPEQHDGEAEDLMLVAAECHGEGRRAAP